MEYESYTVEEHDTLISISLKFNMPLYSLLLANQLSESSILYPGLSLKVVKGYNKEDEPEQSSEIKDVNRLPVFYCSKEGDVKGKISYNEHAIMFTPDCYRNFYCFLRNPEGLSERESLEFHEFLSLNDIFSISLVEYPGFDSENRHQDQLYLKLILSRTGLEKNDPIKNTPKGTIYFKIFSNISNRNPSAYELSKEKVNAFISGVLILAQNHYFKANKSCTLVTHSMKSDHPLVLLRQQYLIYYKNLINWEVFITQSLESLLNIQHKLNSNSPCKPTPNEAETIEFSLPLMSESSKILNDSMIKRIVESLPKYLQCRDWDLVFSTEKDGWSLTTFYRNCENYGSNILVIKDENQSVFGGFASQSWMHSNRYYGNGECFLFSFAEETIKVYFASLVNEFYMSSDFECIIMGGGNDSGLFVNQDLTKGRTGKSETFMNDPLTFNADFNIFTLEVWGLV